MKRIAKVLGLYILTLLVCSLMEYITGRTRVENMVGLLVVWAIMDTLPREDS